MTTLKERALPRLLTLCSTVVASYTLAPGYHSGISPIQTLESHLGGLSCSLSALSSFVESQPSWLCISSSQKSRHGERHYSQDTLVSCLASSVANHFSYALSRTGEHAHPVALQINSSFIGECVRWVSARFSYQLSPSIDWEHPQTLRSLNRIISSCPYNRSSLS